jgi:hypothetical protein
MVPCSGGNIVGILPRYVRMGVGPLEKAGIVEEKSGNGYSGRGGGCLVGTECDDAFRFFAQAVSNRPQSYVTGERIGQGSEHLKWRARAVGPGVAPSEITQSNPIARVSPHTFATGRMN